MELSKTESGLMAFQTVRIQFEGYTNQESEKENWHMRYRELWETPQTSDTRIWRKKLLLNFPITAHNINNTNYMVGHDQSIVGGKAEINKKISMDTGEYTKITEDFYKLKKFLTLTADVMFVNGNEFMITPERNIKFVKVEHIPSLTPRNLI